MPNSKSRIGFQLLESPDRLSSSSLHDWIDSLNRLQASWAVLKQDPAGAIPKELIQLLLESEIEPIVHLDAPVSSIDSPDFNPLAYALAEIGIRHLIVYDQPNNRDSWPAGAWDQSQLVERYLDWTLPLLQSSLSAGLVPTLAPISPGGDYWDTAFLRGYLKGIARRTGSELLKSLALAAYAWTQGKALDWGSGGPVAWPAARPYYTPENSQDQLGVNIAEWYTSIAEANVGIRLPVVVVGGGARVSEEGHAVTNGAIAQALRNPVDFPGVHAFCFEALPPQSLRHAWFAPTSEAKQGNAKAPEDEGEKRLNHYLLLPTSQELAVRAWRQATAFALTEQPVVGFDPEEARSARQVTLAGDVEAIPTDIEDRLLASGCQVQRMSFLPRRKSACEHPPSAEKSPGSGETK